MEKLKFFIFPGYMVSSTLSHWTLAALENPSFIPKIYGDIWDLSLTKSLIFVNISNITPTKLCLQSSA